MGAAGLTQTPVLQTLTRCRRSWRAGCRRLAQPHANRDDLSHLIDDRASTLHRQAEVGPSRQDVGSGHPGHHAVDRGGVLAHLARRVHVKRRRQAPASGGLQKAVVAQMVIAVASTHVERHPPIQLREVSAYKRRGDPCGDRLRDVGIIGIGCHLAARERQR